MDVDELNTGEKIAGVSAVLLFIFMFFDWFGVEVSGSAGCLGAVPGAGGSAWDALDFIPIVLVITIVVALINVFLRLSDSEYEPPVSMNVAVAVLGGLSALLILFRIIAPPGFGSFGGVSVDATARIRHLPRPDHRRRHRLRRLPRRCRKRDRPSAAPPTSCRWRPRRRLTATSQCRNAAPTTASECGPRLRHRPRRVLARLRHRSRRRARRSGASRGQVRLKRLGFSPALDLGAA